MQRDPKGRFRTPKDLIREWLFFWLDELWSPDIDIPLPAVEDYCGEQAARALEKDAARIRADRNALSSGGANRWLTKAARIRDVREAIKRDSR